jgi:hypothetical protein
MFCSKRAREQFVETRMRLGEMLSRNKKAEKLQKD